MMPIGLLPGVVGVQEGTHVKTVVSGLVDALRGEEEQ